MRFARGARDGRQSRPPSEERNPVQRRPSCLDCTHGQRGTCELGFTIRGGAYGNPHRRDRGWFVRWAVRSSGTEPHPVQECGRFAALPDRQPDETSSIRGWWALIRGGVILAMQPHYAGDRFAMSYFDDPNADPDVYTPRLCAEDHELFLLPRTPKPPLGCVHRGDGSFRFEDERGLTRIIRSMRRTLR